MMRLTSVTCGSVSLSVAPRGRSRTCRGRVCFGGFLLFFLIKRAREGTRLPGQSAGWSWAQGGAGILLFGVMEREKSRFWGEKVERADAEGLEELPVVSTALKSLSSVRTGMDSHSRSSFARLYQKKAKSCFK